LFVTSAIGISSGWIPSKHFQVTYILNFKLQRSEKNALLSIFSNDSKDCGGPKQNIAVYQSNMHLKNAIMKMKNPQFLKNIQNVVQILLFSLFPFQNCPLHDLQ